MAQYLDMSATVNITQQSILGKQEPSQSEKKEQKTEK